MKKFYRKFLKHGVFSASEQINHPRLDPRARGGKCNLSRTRFYLTFSKMMFASKENYNRKNMRSLILLFVMLTAASAHAHAH